MDTLAYFNGKRSPARFRDRSITRINPGPIGPRYHGMHFLHKDPLAGLLGCDCEAAVGDGSLFRVPIESAYGL